MKLWFVRAVFWCWFVIRGYYWWSKLWRVIWEWDSPGTVMTEFRSLEALTERVSQFIWTQDPLGGKLDYISRPETVEMKFQHEEYAVGDCDDFSIYIADRINASEMPLEAYLLSVVWFDERGKYHGHNVCAIRPKDTTGVAAAPWGHMSNWFKGAPRWGFESPKDIAEWIATQNPRDGKGRLVGYALATVDLKLRGLELGA